jgi:hypothetical protein
MGASRNSGYLSGGWRTASEAAHHVVEHLREADQRLMVHDVVLCELHYVIRWRPDFGDVQFRRIVDVVEPKIVQKTPGHLDDQRPAVIVTM